MACRCIVVVDDDPDFREMVEQVLNDLGWEVISCQDGLSAHACVRQRHPDVILLDLWLETPQTGRLVLDTLLADPETAEIPVIVCSTDEVQLRERRSWLERCATGVLEKPFDLDELQRVVGSVVECRTAVS